MLYSWEVSDAVMYKTGIRLRVTEWTNKLVIEKSEHANFCRRPDVPYECALFGPFQDPDAPEPRDTRIFVVVREIGKDHTTLQLLVQDHDDDAFLIPSAEGVEKYDKGLVTL